MKNKIKIIRAAFLFLFLGFVILTGFAQEKPMITVLPFQAIEVPEHVSKIITQLFETNIVNTGAYEVLSQNERDQILAAQAESISGCTDESCALEIGRLLAAEQIILGTVATLGTKYIINAKVIDVTTSKTLGADMISAASVEDLDTACAKLTRTLVAKAIPDIKIAETAEPETKPEAVAAEEKKPEPVVVEKEKPEPVKVEKEVKPVEPGKFNLPSYLSFAAGTVLTGAGNFTGSISFETRLKSLDAWAAYMAAEGDTAESLYSWSDSADSYSDLYERYKINSIASYSTWGLGGAALTAAPFLGDSYLSGGGKLTLAGGVLLNTAGNVFAVLSSKNAFAVKKLYAEYMSAQGDAASDAYDKYEDVYGRYNINRTAGYGLWGAGTALQIGSYFIPGNKKPVNSSFVQKLLAGAGSALFAGGSYTSALSMNAFINAQSAWKDYITAGEAAADLYDTYEKKWGNYTKLGYASYGLWAGGGLAYIAALFIPSQGSSGKTAQIPVSLNIKPALTGLGAEINIKL